MDQNAQAYLDAASITDPTMANAIDELTIGMKSASLWGTKVQAFLPLLGGSPGSHSVNLIDPSQFNLSFFNNVLHNANGITGDGIGAYASTDWSTSQTGDINSAHMLVYSRSKTPVMGGGRSIMGTMDASSYCGIGYNYSYVGVIGVNRKAGFSGVKLSPEYSLEGSICVTRTSAAMQKSYMRSRTPVANTALTATGSTTEPTFILARNQNGPVQFTDINVAAISLGAGLSDAEYATLNSLICAFQTRVGRAVNHA